MDLFRRRVEPLVENVVLRDHAAEAARERHIRLGNVHNGQEPRTMLAYALRRRLLFVSHNADDGCQLRQDAGIGLVPPQAPDDMSNGDRERLVLVRALGLDGGVGIGEIALDIVIVLVLQR
jgi:hypothetical protein